MPRLKIVRRQGALEQVRYRKADDGRHYLHDSESPTDVVLGELGKKRVTVLVPRGDVDGWERAGATTWLSNRPRGRTMSKRSSSKKRRPPKGFRTWSAFMASIRPGAKKKARRTTTPKRARAGGVMKKRKSRKSGARKRARTRIVYRSNKPAKRGRRRTHYRRNAPGGIVGKTIGLAVGGVMGGAAMLVGEGTARLVTSDLFKKDPGTLVGGAIQAATGVAAGTAVEQFFGRGRYRQMARQVAHDLVSGVAASLMRTTLKQMNVPMINRALSDGGGMRVIRPLAPGSRRSINGYVRQRGLNGYVQPDQLNGVNERIEQQLGYRP